MKPSISMCLCRTVERDMQEVWLELEKVYKSGLAKSIGVSNFEPETIDRLLNPAQWEGGLCTACTVVPAVNQVELHPSWPQRRLSRYCHSRGIRMVAYAPLANPSHAARRRGSSQPNGEPCRSGSCQASWEDWCSGEFAFTCCKRLSHVLCT